MEVQPRKGSDSAEIDFPEKARLAFEVFKKKVFFSLGFFVLVFNDLCFYCGLFFVSLLFFLCFYWGSLGF